MKAKVIQPFRCRLSRENYAVGSIYEGDAERIAELVSKGKVEVEKPETAHIPKAEKPKKNAK